MSHRLGGCLALVLIASACQPSKGERRPRTRPVVQIFNAGESKSGAAVDQITESAYRQELARARLAREGSLQAAALTPALKTRLLADLIDRRLLTLDASKHGVTVSTAAVAKEMALMKNALSERELRQRLVDSYQRTGDLEAAIERRLLVGALMSKRAHASIEVSEAEVAEAWSSLRAEDRRVPKLVRASQIVVRTEDEGNEIIKQLRRGKDFAELAAARSLGPEAARGGDLGWFEPGVMPRIFDDVCFSLKPGQTSKLTPSEYGFHVFRVAQVEPERDVTLVEMEGRLRSRILHQKLQNAEQAYLQKLRANYDTVADERLLAAIE